MARTAWEKKKARAKMLTDLDVCFYLFFWLLSAFCLGAKASSRPHRSVPAASGCYQVSEARNNFFSCSCSSASFQCKIANKSECFIPRFFLSGCCIALFFALCCLGEVSGGALFSQLYDFFSPSVAQDSCGHVSARTSQKEV